MNYRNQILTGDALSILKTLESESVQMICTSPPYYGLRNYNTEPLIWDGLPDCEHVWNALPEKRNRWSGDKDASEKQTSNRGSAWIIPQGEFCLRCNGWRGHLGLEPTPFLYIDHLVQIFREARRVLRRDGTLWLNLGDSYANDTKWGGATGGKHVHALHGDTSIGRAKRHTGFKPKDLMLIPSRVAIALQDDGWWLRADICWHKVNAMPESVQDRPTLDYEHVFLLTKQSRYYYDIDAIREPHTTDNLLYEMSKASKWGHKKLLTNKRNIADYQDETHCYHPAGRNKRSVWSIPTAPFSAESIGIDDVDHFAVMPEKLVEICVLAGSSPKACEICNAPWQRVTDVERRGPTIANPIKLKITAHKGEQTRRLGPDIQDRRIEHGWRPTCTCANEGTGKCVVLDPFSGAGTVALVASQLSRDWIGIDLNPNYKRLAMKRIETIQPDMWEAEAVS